MKRKNLIIIGILILTTVSFFYLYPHLVRSPKPASSESKDIFLSKENTRQKKKTVWNFYQNRKYKFIISYPDYLDPFKIQKLGLFEASSKAEEIKIKVFDKPLNGSEFLAGDGVVGNSIFKYSATKNQWQYIGMYGGPNNFAKDKYKVYDFRPEDGIALQKEGYIPVEYKTKSGLSAWVGKSTDKHSTQGGDDWQIAFVESPQKRFTIKVYMKQCLGFYNSCGRKTQSFSDSRTIFSVLDTLRFLSPVNKKIIATVSSISFSAKIIRLKHSVDGFSVIVILPATKIVFSDGETATLKDLISGERIQAVGRSGDRGALLAEKVVVFR